MKYAILILQLILFSCTSAQEKFDIMTFHSPKGWAKSSTPETLTFSKEDANGNFCLITLYKSIAGGNEAKTNFDISWKALVQEQLGTVAATMQPHVVDNDWETQIGSAPFEKEGLKGAAILITSTKNSLMTNILVLTNSDLFQIEMERFLESITLTGTSDFNQNNISSTPSQASFNSKESPELWANMRYIPKDYYDITAGALPVTDYYVVYPNGDYFPDAPYEGLNKLNKSVNSESWGKLTMKGSKGRFKNNYDEISVTKKTQTYMEKEGYTHGFYKCLSVDGARLEGAYTHVAPNWGRDPQLNYINGSGCQFAIYFKKDGTFDDRGIFSSTLNNCVSGNGTYSIENYTITFRYNDGRVVQRLFSAPPTRNISQYDEVVYIGRTSYYKKQ